MRFNSEEDDDSSSTEFRPSIGHSMEDYSSSATNRVETVVPPPPSSPVRPFRIHVPERLPHAEALTAPTSSSDAAVSTHNQYEHNIEIPVHFFHLQLHPLESGQGFAIAA